jgi:hypothetical protein
LIDIEKGPPMLRKVSTLLFLATSLAVSACEDEIIDDAIPVSDAARAEASKEGGETTSDAASGDASSAEGGASTGDGSTAESAAPDGGSKPDAASAEAAPADAPQG